MTGKASVRARVGGREVVVSNLDKVLFPEAGFTKGQMIEYFTRVSAVMLPHIQGRPLTMKRFPGGTASPHFFEKHAPVHSPEWIRRITVPSTGDSAPVDYLRIDDLAALVWAANLASIEFHVPLWHVGRRRTLPAPPDYLVFDLDPGEGASIVECCQVAGLIVDELDEGRTCCRPKTSGSKGLQLYVPLSGRPTWEKVRARAHDVASVLERANSALVVSNMRKTLRRGKVLIDWSQNHPAKTTVAAYSLRGLQWPTASTPVNWDEVDQCAESGDPAELRFSSYDVLDRIERRGDLFAAG